MAPDPLDEETIFHQARKIEAGGTRDDYLRHACGANVELIARVLALLEVHETEKTFLASPAGVIIEPRK